MLQAAAGLVGRLRFMPSLLYVHIPFCLSKCPYCDFYSIPRSSPVELDAYVELLLRQLELTVAADDLPGPLTSVYFGGGTPSLLSADNVGQILQAAADRFGFAGEIEISLEANPGTVSLASLTGYRAAGVNRLSLGVQSLNDGHLRQLGRLHTAADGVRAIRLARQAGFNNLACDLMFGLPGQSLAELQNDLTAYLDHGPQHLSCYGLTVEAGTPLADSCEQGAVLLPDDDLSAEAFLLLHAGLTEAGFVHYEIANYARPGFACRHNQGYWQRQACLGLGAGAHSFRTLHWGERWAVPNNLAAYQRAVRQGRDPAVCLESFDRRAAMSEALYLGLRTRQGVAEQAFAQVFGAALAETFAEELRQLAPHLDYCDGAWRFRPASWLLYDRLIQAFL